MNSVLVAVPILRGKRRFHIDKGRPWSVVEHLILAALVDEALSAEALAKASALPRRVVIEILIRLMRVGWVEVSEQKGQATFRASLAGRAVASLNDLPTAPKRIKRWMSFLIDRVTGAVFRSRDLTVVHRNDLVARARKERLVELEPRVITGPDDIQTVANVLLDEDERLAFIDGSGDRLVERFALISVRGTTIERSLRLTEPLQAAILEAAREAPASPSGDRSPRVKVDEDLAPVRRSVPQETRAVAMGLDDLVFGGTAHGDALFDIIRRARRHVIIHSCFVTRQGFETVADVLIDAARRGVIVDILWGEDPDKPGDRNTSNTITKLRADPNYSAIPTLRIHPFSTRSHGKFVIADDPRSGRLTAIVGSCNWLSSRFDSIDISLRLRDPRLVGDLLYLLTELVKGSDGDWTPLSLEFAGLASRASQETTPAVQSARAQLVIGPVHGEFVRKARDTAHRRIIVASHRLSEVANAAVIVPAMRAAGKRNVHVNLLYTRPSGAADDAHVLALGDLAKANGVLLTPIPAPRLHAKVLVWDEDHALITSQNWLSGDPTWANPGQEVGVYISARGIGAEVARRLQEAVGSAAMKPSAFDQDV